MKVKLINMAIMFAASLFLISGAMITYSGALSFTHAYPITYGLILTVLGLVMMSFAIWLTYLINVLKSKREIKELRRRHEQKDIFS
ncbi:MAG: hypothetical protein ABJG88_01295 [Litorimonas sp.]